MDNTYPFSKVEASTLAEKWETTSLYNTHLIDAGEHIWVIDFAHIGSGMRCFDLSAYTFEGMLKDRYSICIDKKTSKLLKRYHVWNAVIFQNDLYALIGKWLLRWSLDDISSGHPASVIDIDYDTTYMTVIKDQMYLCFNAINSDMSMQEHARAVYRYNPDIRKLEKIYSDSPADRFLFFFNSPKLFAFHSSGIFALSAGKPEMHRLDFNGVKECTHATAEPWNAVSDEERETLLDLAYSDPNLVFDRIGERLLNELSANIRLDIIDDQHLGITYFPGKDAKSELRVHFDLYELDGNELNFLMRYKGMLPSISEKQPRFHFPAFDDHNYFIKDGKRYQLGVLPAGTLDMEGEERTQKWKQSLTSNQFELCLFVGHYALD